MMVSMAGLQVFVVRFFFQGARKGRPDSYPRNVIWFIQLLTSHLRRLRLMSMHDYHY